jgi:predicted nucleotidyltransferase
MSSLPMPPQSPKWSKPSLMSERAVREILASRGPLTGKELRDESKIEELALWRLCHSLPDIITTIIGRRYLRLDKSVEGYARLSPSIKREFLTYTVCGLNKDHKSLAEKAHALWRNTRRISREKLDFAGEAMSRVCRNSSQPHLTDHVSFLIAGDIVYEMAHLEPRPEASTGRLVRGSDLDIIIIAEDEYSKDILTELDKVIYREKYLCLIRPECREEIDYIIKDLKKIRDQMAFDRFEFMVAAKILIEGEHLLGSKAIFDRVKELLLEHGIPGKIAALENKASVSRRQAEACLLRGEEKLSEKEALELFFTLEETDEIF